MIIGLTGSFGSGCTKVSEYLESDEGFYPVSLSALVREAVLKGIRQEQWDATPFKEQRKLLQDKGDELRELKHDVLVERVLDTVRQLDEQQKDVAIDSIRNHYEAKRLRSEFNDFWLIAVEADKETRWGRCKKRYDGDFEAFDRDDARDSGEDQPDNGQHVRECVQLADACIINNRHFAHPGDWTTLRETIEGYVCFMRTPRYGLPTHEESFMAQAYVASLSSTCSRRLVGAVLVSPDEEVISTGFNHIPEGNRTCSELGGRKGYCYREEKAREKLANMKYCPNCGNLIESCASSQSLPWRCVKCSAKLPHDLVPGKMLDLCRALHAEEDAILQARKIGGTSLKDCTLYTTTFPCPLCAKMIADVGITKVVYVEPYPMTESVEILDNSNPRVHTEQYEGILGRAFTRVFGSP